MELSITKSECEQIFKSRARERFELLQIGKKITFEFRVNVKEKDKFLQWIKILSSAEFRVDVDLDNIWVRGFTKDPKYNAGSKVVVRVKVSGKEKDLNRWNDNLCCVAGSLSGDYDDIIYFKNIDKRKIKNRG